MKIINGMREVHVSAKDMNAISGCLLLIYSATGMGHLVDLYERMSKEFAGEYETSEPTAPEKAK